MDRPGVHQVPEGSGEEGKMEKKNGCEVICGVPMTPAVKGQVKVKIDTSESSDFLYFARRSDRDPQVEVINLR